MELCLRIKLNIYLFYIRHFNSCMQILYIRSLSREPMDLTYDNYGSIYHTVSPYHVVISIHALACIQTTTYLTLKHDYSYFRLGEPWGCLIFIPGVTGQSLPTRLSIKLLQQQSSACVHDRDSNQQPFDY